jgi:hypothetical protein
MLITTIATILTLHAGAVPSAAGTERPIEVQYYRGVPMHPPPCGNGWDLSAVDGMCYPNGFLPPQDQEARRRYYRPQYDQPQYYEEPPYRPYGLRRRPVPCGDGADVDMRDGRCYPTGTVPRQFQNRPENYYRRY